MAQDVTQVVWSDKDYRIEVSANASADFLRCITETRFVSGQREYRRTDVSSQLKRFQNAQFFTLQHDDHVVGTYLIDEQRLLWAGSSVRGFYRGLLSIDPAHRGTGLGASLVRESLDHVRQQLPQDGMPAWVWSSIAATNVAARQLNRRLGHQEIGSLQTKLEYQQFLRHKKQPLLIDTLDESIDAAWQRTFGDAQVRSGATPTDGWLGIRRGRDILACRQHVTTLDLTPLPGLFGWVDRYLMPMFPPGRRRFDPTRFRYVTVTDLVTEHDGVSLWRSLRNALMTRHDTHFVNRVSAAENLTGDLIISAGPLSNVGTSVDGGQIALWPPDL